MTDQFTGEDDHGAATPSHGAITEPATAVVNASAAESHTLTVHAEVSGGMSARLVISVQEGEAPEPVSGVEPTTAKIGVVGFNSDDPAAGDVSYRIEDNHQGRFRIDPDTGTISFVEGKTRDKQALH